MRVLQALVFGYACMLSCGGRTTQGTPDGGPDDGGPPPPPPPTNKVETFAIKTLYLGETPRNGGAPSYSAWKSYGYNIDGKVTSATSTDVCTLAQGAPKSVQVDGNNGIDNSFGENILPIIQTAAGLNTPSQTISQSIQSGKFTMLIEVTGFDDTPTQTANGMTGQFFPAGPYPGGTPTFDMTTDWPVDPQYLNDQATIASGSQFSFTAGYIHNGTFVSGGDLSTGGGMSLILNLVFQGQAWAIPIHDGVISFNHGATSYDGSGNPLNITADATKATDGTIAGVINTTDLVNGLKAIAGRISPSLCGPAFTGIANQITQQSDIMNDGSNAPGQTCNAISIGVGFDAVEVKNPDQVAILSPPPPDPCATDAGAD